MSQESKTKIKQNYLTACATALAAAFFSVFFYPEQHGISSASKTALVVVAVAMLGLFAWIAQKAHKNNELDEPHQSGTSEPDTRLKKMAILWFGFATLLSGSMVRYPIREVTDENRSSIDPSAILVIFIGVGIALYSTAKIIFILKQKEPNAN